MLAGVYEIVNLYDGHCTAYVGSSQNIERRWVCHRSDLRLKKHRNQFLQRAWDKYGSDAFMWRVVEEIDDLDLLLERETFWLREYRAVGRVYNLCPVGGTTRGLRLSAEQRQAISKRQTGVKRSPMSAEHRRKIGEANRGKVRSAETRRKISEVQKGKKLSAEHRRKISEASRGRVVSEATREKLRIANTGKRHSEETKQKLSIKGRRENLSAETLRKMSESHKGKSPSAETRRKLREVHRGRVLSDEHRQRLRDAQAKEYPALYNLHTGETLSAGRNLSALCRERGWSQGDIWSLVATRKARSYRGWILAENAETAIVEGRAGKQDPYRSTAYPAFVHVETGRIIKAGWNLSAMCREHNLPRSGMHKVISSERSSCNGWVLKKIADQANTAELAKMLCPEAKAHPALVNLETGQVIPAGVNLAEACKTYGLGNSHIYAVVAGRRRICKGWILQDTAEEPVS
jgi:group I intron endonuclease